jgi:hypothetical protein
MIIPLDSKEIEALKVLLKNPVSKETRDSICEVELKCGLGLILVDIDKLPKCYIDMLGLHDKSED